MHGKLLEHLLFYLSLMIIIQMSTKNQLLRGSREKKKEIQIRRPPFVKGSVVSIPDFTPKKPNSARRKIAKCKVLETIQKRVGQGPFITIKRPKYILAKIPGEKHGVKQHQTALIRGGGSKDCNSVNHTVVLGVCDVPPTPNRVNGRSHVGAKSNKKN